MEILTLHPKNKEQLNALKAFSKALKIDFGTEESSFNPEFVAKINRGQEQIKAGKVIKIVIEDLWK